MNPKTTKIIYWILTSIFVLFCLMDAFGGLTHQDAGVQSLKHLGYPVYLLDISGTAKLIGALCVLQTRFVIIKEWAYAGFAISFIAATWSHFASGDSFGMAIFPAIFLVFMLLTYYFWKRVQVIKALGL